MARSSSATTPVTSDEPQTLVEWLRYLKNAATVPSSNAEYGDAQEATQYALQQIARLNAEANQQDFQKLMPGKLGTAAVNFGHGASLGLAGDPAYLALAREANPGTALASDVAGTAATGTLIGGAPVFAGASPVVTGAIVGGGTAAIRGAVEPLPGFSRKESALLYGTGGVVGGAIMGKVLSKLVPWMRTVGRNIKAKLGPGASAVDVDALTEAAIRQQLGKMNIAPEMVERAVQSWKQTGTLSVRGAPPPAAPQAPPPPTMRPGETITQTSPKGFEVTGTRPTPEPPMTPTILEMQTGQQLYPRGSMPDVGTGRTLPYYPRGGRVEQAFGPQPVSSPGVPSQAGSFEHILNALKATPAQDLPGALSALRALNVPLGGTDEQLIALLTQGTPR